MEQKPMIAKPKRTQGQTTWASKEELDRGARLIANITWASLAFTLIIATTLWLVGAPLPVVLLLAPLALAGIPVLIAINNLRVGFKRAQLVQQRLQENNHFLEKMCIETELQAAKQANNLEYRIRQLQGSSDVINAIYSAISRSSSDIDQMMAESTHLISKCFGYYAVNIYLLETNPDQESGAIEGAKVAERLILRAANTQAGYQLIEKGYSLTLDQESVVAVAARTRKPCLAADIHQDPQYLLSNEFPDTQSEAALPLMDSKRLIGVLDIRSSVSSSLTHENLDVLQNMANQLAIAIEYTSIFISNLRNLHSLERAHGTISQDGRSKLLHNQPDRGYRVGPTGEPVPVDDTWDPVMRKARESGQIVFGSPVADAFTLAVPIKIRNQVAGVVRLRKPLEAGKWRPEEIALVERLSDRLSAALESARLFEETRRAAEREHLTGEINARIRSTNDPQAVLQIAARELRRALRADRAQLLVQSAVISSTTTSQVDAESQVGDEQ
jgi:GAF domain-containing protein